MLDMVEQSTGQDEWLPTTDAAAIVHVSKFTVERMIKSGELVGTKFRGSLRVSRNSLNAYVEEHKLRHKRMDSQVAKGS